MGDERFTRFDYLLNAMQAAGDQPRPADHGYGEKRRKLYEYVRELERKAAAYDARAASPVAADTPEEHRLRAAGFDMADDWDRPDERCDCPKCARFYAAITEGKPDA